jgi:hypothetical protein
MDERHLNTLLSIVRRRWLELEPERRPKGVWISYREPISPDIVEGITTPVIEAWFLDERGITRRDVWEFLRFYTVHCVQPWCGRTFPERDPIFGRVHEFGLATFADYRGSADIALETVWGNLHGRGWRYKINDQGRIELVGLQWLS